MREDEVGLMLFPGKAVAVELNRWLRNSARHCAKAVPNPHKACEAVASPPPAEPWCSGCVLTRDCAHWQGWSRARVCPAPAMPCGVPGGASDRCAALPPPGQLCRQALSRGWRQRLGHPHGVVPHSVVLTWTPCQGCESHRRE